MVVGWGVCEKHIEVAELGVLKSAFPWGASSDWKMQRLRV